MEEIAGGAEVLANSEELNVLTFKDGVTITAIIERITQNKLR